jgi:hypothetical protein
MNAYKYGSSEAKIMLRGLRRMLKEERGVLIESLGI